MNTGNRLRFAVVAGTAGLLATLYAGASSIIDRGWQTAWNQAETTIERTAKAAESIVNNHFLQVDSALASLPDLVAATSQGTPLTPLVVRRVLQSVNFQTFASRDIALIRPSTGDVWSAARQPLSGRPLPASADILRAKPAPGSHAVVGPLKNPRTGDWTLFLVRAVDLPGHGDFLAVAEMPVSSLTAALSPATQVEGLSVVLAYGDRTVVASIPHDEFAMGTRPPAAANADAERREGIEASRATLYGDIRLTLRLPAEAALQEWSADRRRVTLIAATGGGLLVLFAGIVLIGLFQRERLERARKSAQQLLEDAIGRMSDGFAMWDAEGRLTTCNERFSQLHGEGPHAAPFPDPVSPSRPWLGSFEQEFHAGRWYLVTQSLTSGGGVVAVLKDITERRSQERLILDHSEELARLSARFETTVKSGASKLEASACNASLEVDMMAGAARDAVAQARFVSSTAEGTSERVRIVASGVEQLRAAIDEISARVDAASTVNARVAACSDVATTVMAALDKSASQVSAVVDIISGLASQTNLLALNATIEAARAGEAGRGFAVVASEVKALAAQTAQSTDAIARQVRSMQQSSVEASRTIASIAAIVAELTDVSRSIELAVHEQTAAVAAISESTQQSAERTSDVSQAVAMIAERSEQINRSTEGLRDTMVKLLDEARTLGHESQRFLASVRRA